MVFGHGSVSLRLALGALLLLTPCAWGEEEEGLVVRKEAVKAWVRIGDPGTHEALLEYIKLPSTEKEMLELAILCATELRHFKSDTHKQKFELLEDHIKANDMVYGAGIGSFMASALAADWWDKLKDPLLESFNILTDMKFDGYPACRDWWRKVRKTWR